MAVPSRVSQGVLETLNGTCQGSRCCAAHAAAPAAPGERPGASIPINKAVPMAAAGPTTSESLEQHLIRTNNPKTAQELMVRTPTTSLALVLMLIHVVHQLKCLAPVALLHLPIGGIA